MGMGINRLKEIDEKIEIQKRINDQQMIVKAIFVCLTPEQKRSFVKSLIDQGFSTISEIAELMDISEHAIAVCLPSMHEIFNIAQVSGNK